MANTIAIARGCDRTRNGQTLHAIAWGPETRPDGAEQDAG